MILERVQASALRIPFNATFKHASAARRVTQAVWIEASARDGPAGYGEGCPREYVTGENLRSAHAFVSAHCDDWLASIQDVESLVSWTVRHRRDIDANPAAWTAVELAFLDALGKEEARSLESLLGMPRISGCFGYSAVLGDDEPHQFETQLRRYHAAGFSSFKIKLSGDRERDLSKVRALGSVGIPPDAVRADANNLWKKPAAAMEHLQALSFPFFGLEEPLQAGDLEGMHALAQAFDTRIILDESLLRVEQMEPLSRSADRWIVNLRVSKMGGLLRSLEIASSARKLGLRVIVGAQVGETSLLTRAGLTAAQNARDILIAQEGAFGKHLLQGDVVDAPIMFGARGVLDADALGLGLAPGLGLAVSCPLEYIRPLDGVA